MPLSGRRCLRARKHASGWIATCALLAVLALAACQRDGAGKDASKGQEPRPGQVTVQGDDRLAETLTWHAPPVTIAEDGLGDARERAATALSEGRLFADADSAIPLYLAILDKVPGDKVA